MMHERFTDRARRVMQLANQEAQRFNHEYLGTEHMLLGIIKDGNGCAARLLKILGIDLRKVRLQVESLVQPGPDMVTMWKLPRTPVAKAAVTYAVEESDTLRHNYVGTEHLLLGLLREQEGVAAQVLMNLGLKLEDVREEVLSILADKKVAEPPHRAEQREICKVRGHVASGHVLTSNPPWNICEYCNTRYRYETNLVEMDVE
jgi:ATP-dependent Clp protease ATP-binding subunit ClpC